MGKRVLVVDDDPGIQGALQAALELEDYEVDVAENGLVALEKLTQATAFPDLLLLDLMMPKMDGHDLVVELQKRGWHKSFPILLITADMQAKQKMKDMPIQGFIAKPFDLVAFLDKVEELLNLGCA